MASDPIAIPSLECMVNAFSNRIELIAVYTQPDRKSGRGKKLTPNAIKTWADSHGIPVFQPEKMNSDAIAEFAELNADFVMVMAYGHILPTRMLKLSSKGFFNLHASLLPKLRGASPVETAIVTGEKVTGVTLMQVIPALDAGPVLEAETVLIKPDETGPSLRHKLANACIPLLERNLPGIISGEVACTEQNTENATYCRLIDKHDGFLDFSLSAPEIIRHIHGFQPWPGALFQLNEITYRIGSATIADDEFTSGNPGRITCERKSMKIETAKGSILVLELQKPGGKMLPIAEFLNGHPIKTGQIISFPSRYPLVQNYYFRKPNPPESRVLT